MKKLIVMALMAFATVGAYAQHAVGSISIQPKVALNLASLTDIDDSKMKVGLAAGAELEYQMTDMFSLAGGLLYSMQGVKTELKGLGTKSTTTTKLDYINIPIVANVYLAKGFAIKAGLQPGFNVSHKYDSEATVEGIKVTSDGDVEGFKSFDLSIPLGLSYEYENIVLDARYNLGLTKTSDNKGVDSRNSVFQISLGYRFDL